MDVKNLADELKNKAGEVENLMRRKLPVIVGRMAKDHYQENFRKGGFQNRGLRKWPVTRRQTSGIAGADGQYGPLLSRRNHLFGSIKYVPSDFRVLVSNDLPYAPIHNWGGETNPTVTARMRRFAWAMYYHAQGTSKKPTGGKRKPKNQYSDTFFHFIIRLLNRSISAGIVFSAFEHIEDHTGRIIFAVVGKKDLLS
ncbi:MAG: hypothetical protein IKD29_02620 [Lentisphaeria bacterium]|nr:hypothetical protein [Lentisphaeria bacterium]